MTPEVLSVLSVLSGHLRPKAVHEHPKETPDVSATTTAITSRARLTVTEVCEDLGVSRSTFYEWRTKGVGPRCIKLPNGEIRVRRVELERWLDSREEAA